MVKQDVPIDQGFFDRKAYLSVSGQLHLEAMCHGLGSVYSFGPVFRAENSRTPLHLAEFYMLEVEQSFVSSIDDISLFIENMVKSVTRELLDVCAEDIQNAKPSQTETCEWLEKPFVMLTYREAVKILEAHTDQLKTPLNSREGLSKEQELFLVRHIGSPVFVVEWPSEMKPFYMRHSESNPKMVQRVFYKLFICQIDFI